LFRILSTFTARRPEVRQKYFLWYRMAVLTYYRCEWTDISDDDHEYRFALTTEVDALLRRCCKDKANIPNAAKEVAIFMEISKERL
jgi:hypothetical protein